MASFQKGLAFLKEQQEKLGVGNRTWMPKLWLKSGEQARFWFLTDADDILVPFVHQVQKPKKGGGFYNTDVLCGRGSTDDPVENCPRCLADDRPWPRPMALVYAEVIAHNGPNVKKDGETWEQRRTDQGIKHIENPNAIYLLTIKSKLANQIDSFMAGVSNLLDEEAPTETPSLLAQSFVLKKEGEGTATTEILTPSNPKPMPDAVKAAVASMPDLATVIEQEFGESKATGGKTFASGSAAAAGATAFDMDSLPAASSDDLELIDFEDL